MNAASRGRPVDPDKQAEQKQKLIAAARSLLAEKNYRAITIRELGEKAGVNSAMIRYYFESKEGLFVALLDQMSSNHFNLVKQAAGSQTPLREVIGGLLQMLHNNSATARLIHDEIMKEDSKLRDAFIERFPKRMAAILPQLVQRELKIQDPKIAKYLAFNLVSMLVLPFIGEPVRKAAWQISDEELCDPYWADHIYQLFINGCRSFIEPAANQEESK